ncbi:MAG: V-type ATPase subunit [Clostridiales bacterium]|jgi:V/A-type H+-transporting ATPase subunit C|nr:V-type ATPase subunit [Clostridiales bacterium]
MPQPSIAYAVGRVRAAARRPLGDAQLERLLSAASYEEALNMLTEMGWPDSADQDVEQLSIRMLEGIAKLLKDVSPDEELLSIFLLRHDAQNLKSLLKARILGVKPENLSKSGMLDLDTLVHAVNEHKYHKLIPEFRAVMETLEQKTALQVNPMKIDVLIDQALYGLIAKKLKNIKNKAAKTYFATKVDFLNAIALLRLQNIADDKVRFMDLLLPGGTISSKQWAAIQEKPHSLLKAFNGYPVKLQVALNKAIHDQKAIPALEKAVDDSLIALYRDSRNEPFSVDVLVGWLLAHEREAGAVRLIIAGKLNGFPQELIRERLREAYGR